MTKITQNYTWPLMKNTVTLSDRLKMAKFVLTSDKLTQGNEVRKFEEEWSEWLGVKHSLFVSSGSTANLLLVSAWKELYDIPNNAKVIVPACTWVTNVAPIIQCGLTPIFCDINLEDYSFDLDKLQELRDQYGEDIYGIFVTHLLGFPAQVEKFHEIFPNAHILEDVCESHGAVLENGKKAGTYDVGGTFSFYFGHHMTTVEGGMVSTNDPELYDLMRIKRSHGMARESLYFETYKEKYPDVNPSFLFVTDGYNLRNNEIGAVLGRSQLKRLDSMIEIRNRNYERYLDIIKRYSNSTVETTYYVPKTKGQVSSFCFPIVCNNTLVFKDVEELLKRYHIEYRPIVGGNLLRQPFLREYSAECLNADIAHEKGLYIGNNHFVNDSNLDTLDEILSQIHYDHFI